MIDLLAILIQAGSTLLMVGLIWFVQIVHYPLFLRTGEQEFQEYEKQHTRLTGKVVAPVMLLELASSFYLVFISTLELPPALPWAGLFLLLSIWGITFFVQVPQHQKLQDGFDEDLIQKLVLYNWYRTVAWSGRGVLVLWMIANLIRHQD